MTGRFRKTAYVAGALYLLTFVSIPNLALYSPVLNPKYLVGTTSDTGVFFGAILDIGIKRAVRSCFFSDLSPLASSTSSPCGADRRKSLSPM